MSDSEELRATLRAAVAELLEEVGRDADGFGDSSSLFRSGLLDSIASIKLANRLESDFHVRFDQIRFDISKIDSIDAIVRLIQAKDASTLQRRSS